MASEDEDGRGGDDPLHNGLFAFIPEKRKLRSDSLNKYDFEHGVESKRNRTMTTTQEQNGGSKSDQKFSDSTHTNTQRQQTTNTTQHRDRHKLNTDKDKQTARQNKDRTDATYNDGWVKNTDFTTFFIEREKPESTNQGSRDSYPHPMEVAKMLVNIKSKQLQRDEISR